jgi:hypothetical protein
MNDGRIDLILNYTQCGNLLDKSYIVHSVNASACECDTSVHCLFAGWLCANLD